MEYFWNWVLEMKLHHLTEQAEELKIFVQKYITAFCENIDERFSTALPVLSAFGIFDPLRIPKASEAGFPEYGSNDISCLANYFYPDDTEKNSNSSVEQLEIWTCLSECLSVTPQPVGYWQDS